MYGTLLSWEESIFFMAEASFVGLSIVYLGPVGTFSHLVALRRFGENTKLIAKPNIASIFDFLVNHPEACAVVPIENSSGGAIYDTVDMLLAKSGTINILEDLSLDVQLALLGHSGERIRRIYSHFVPIRHHKEWLATNFPGARVVSVESTACAAAKASTSRNAAALAAPGVASIYHLDILQFPIQPGGINVTRFFIIGHPGKWGFLAASKRWKTSSTFQLKNVCGSLYFFLESFSRRAVNLCMIISHPLVGKPESYVFFIEVDGSVADLSVKAALEEASQWCEKFVFLGSYPSCRRYDSSPGNCSLPRRLVSTR